MTLVFSTSFPDCKQVIFDFQGTFPRSTTWTGLGFSVLETWKVGGLEGKLGKLGLKIPRISPSQEWHFFFETAHVWNPRIIRKKLEVRNSSTQAILQETSVQNHLQLNVQDIRQPAMEQQPPFLCSLRSSDKPIHHRIRKFHQARLIIFDM